MEAGIRRAFGFSQPAEEQSSVGDVTNRSWSVRTYRPSDGPPVHVLAAPSTDPDNRRANTPDTYDFWAQQVKLAADDRVLVVTTPIYVPFQHCDAVRMLGLPYGCHVDTIGFDEELIDEPLLTQPFDTDRYLQEIRSAIRSMQNLFASSAQAGNA